MRRRSPRLHATGGLVLLVALAGCDRDPVAPIAAPANVRHVSAAQAEIAAAAAGRSSRGIEDEILRIEARIPGFGGLSVDPATQRLVIYLHDVERAPAALQELARMAPGINVLPSIRAKLGRADATIVRQGQFGFSQLLAWAKMIAGEVRLPGIVALDADEARNQVNVALEPGTSREKFAAATAALGIPEGAIAFSGRRPATNTGTLQDRIRPVAGGYQIQVGSGPYGCTLGFGVDVQFYGEQGYLTASHCARPAGTGTTGDPVYQNIGPYSSNVIGTVALNPPWNLTDPGCMGYSLCSYGDAMYVRSSNSSAFAKRIAATSGWGNEVGTNSPGSVQVNGTFWSNLSIPPYVLVGQTVYKAGRTTGITGGTVVSTCSALVSSGHVVLCADAAEGASAGDGDSGGPVFYPYYTGAPGSPSNPPYAIGVEHASSAATSDTVAGNARCISGCVMYFSEWSTVQSHLSRYFTP